MDPVTIVLTAVKGIKMASAVIDQLSRAIDAANNDNLEEAEKFLEDARKHFSASVDEWDKAGK
jgi:hypothetical protein